jgi:predicted enzyme related to lactoylglutathione lyase
MAAMDIADRIAAVWLQGPGRESAGRRIFGYASGAHESASSKEHHMRVSSVPGFKLWISALLTVPVLLVAPAACVSTAKIDTSGMSFSSEPLLGKVVWNDLITEDLAAAQHFYGELFGWTFEQSSRPGGRPYTLARSGKVYVAGLVQVDRSADGKISSRWLPYTSVADVDDSVSKATAAGGKVAVGARNVSLGRVAAIIDPEGAVIGLVRSRIGDPDDATTAPGAGRVVWTELLANDPAVQAKFYTATVGYEAKTIERRGGQYTLLTHAGSDRAGILKNPSDQADPAWLTYFGVADPAAAATRVAALGGKVILPPSPQLREGSMAVVTDPAGAVLVLQKLNP